LADAPKTLKELPAALNACRRCPLYRDATQGVPGEGPARAKLMLVGEQPGNDEDLAGKPFVGPAGRLLDKALAAAEIERHKVFVTNAVKHFKFTQRGKRRLHQRPNAYEIDQCRIWNELERRFVKPKLILAMGATASRSVLQKSVTISKVRGKLLDLPDGGHAMVTVHPSLLLRIPDSADRKKEFARFTADLRAAKDYVSSL
jgi:uracil-DNA glycosylase